MTEAVDDLRRRHALCPDDDAVADQLAALYLRHQDPVAARQVLQICLASRTQTAAAPHVALLTRLLELPAVTPDRWRRVASWSVGELCPGARASTIAASCLAGDVATGGAAGFALRLLLHDGSLMRAAPLVAEPPHVAHLDGRPQAGAALWAHSDGASFVVREGRPRYALFAGASPQTPEVRVAAGTRLASFDGCTCTAPVRALRADGPPAWVFGGLGGALDAVELPTAVGRPVRTSERWMPRSDAIWAVGVAPDLAVTVVYDRAGLVVYDRWGSQESRHRCVDAPLLSGRLRLSTDGTRATVLVSDPGGPRLSVYDHTAARWSSTDVPCAQVAGWSCDPLGRMGACWDTDGNWCVIDTARNLGHPVGDGLGSADAHVHLASGLAVAVTGNSLSLFA